MSLADAIKREARALGFDAIGIAAVPASPSCSTSNLSLLDRLQSWLERTYHGTMAWMARQPERRADPRQVLPGCRSIISVGMNYLTAHRADERHGFGRIARYAWGRDYHDILGQRLVQLETAIAKLSPNVVTRSYVDTGPVMEKAWAQQAGLGWIGKHSNLVSAQFGSWLLLGEILTTLELDPDEPGTDLCGSCSLCIQACPTQAIPEPYVVDGRRCISYLTIEFRGDRTAIPDELATRMGNHIFGCDDCLDVCPFNLRADPTREPMFQPSTLTLAPSLEKLGQLDESSFTIMFQRSPISRPKYAGFQRNLTIVRNNQP